MLMDREVLSAGLRADPIEGGQPDELGAGDSWGLSLERPNHGRTLAAGCEPVTAPDELGRGCVCRLESNFIGSQSERLAELVPESDVRPLLRCVTSEVGRVASANLFEPTRDCAHDVGVLLDVIAELIASQRAERPALVEAVLQQVPASCDIVERLVHASLL